ncbi:MAG: glutamine amidotransferase [Myxococcota bacterium]|nr:glutamine amidotransferase [Myxococcota bacterium]
MTGHTMPELSARRGDFDRWYADLFGWRPSDVHVVDAIGGDTFPHAELVDGLIISGSACTVLDRAPWSEASKSWILDVIQHGIPTLGVCYGHQLIADGLGGRVGVNPAGREIGVCTVKACADDPLFDGLPEEFAVIQTHVDTVLEMPQSATEIALSDKGRFQALAIGDHVRTVQWHPEFDADIISHYIDVRSAIIDSESGAGTAALLKARVCDVESGRIIARNFLTHFMKS